MYANESSGQKFPLNHFWGCENDGGVPEIEGDYTLGLMSVYPEYLNDPNILLCPSGGEGTVEENFDNADDLDEVWDGTKFVPTSGNPNTDFYPCEGDSSAQSYLYLGWLLNAPGAIDYEGPVPDVSQLPSAMAAIPVIIGAYPDQTLGITAVNCFIVLEAMLNPDISNVSSINADSDYSGNATDLGGLPGGNNINIMRLREGIERFLITDINNPASSAQAQSQISVAYDFFSQETDEFNHVPGGSNVLFMDGHVEFIRYPGKAPVTPLIGALNGLP